MADADVECLLITSEANHRYLTGHATQAFQSTTRPIASVFPVQGDPTLVVASSHVAQAEATSWPASEVRAYDGFEAAAIAELAIVIGKLKPKRIGYEAGPEQRLGLSQFGFVSLREAVKAEWADASALLQSLRATKSKAEVALIEDAGQILGRAFDTSAKAIAPGVREHHIYTTLVHNALELGADRIGYFAMHSGTGNYGRLNGAPTRRVLETGDLVWMDVGCVVDGYWADLTFIAAIGSASPHAREAYRAVRETTEAVIARMGPGTVAGSMADLALAELKSRGATLTSPGRIGHGLGLQLTEWPSIAAGASESIGLGMTIAIEPAWNRDDGHFVTEQNLVVTPDGCARLGPIAPMELPILATRPY